MKMYLIAKVKNAIKLRDTQDKSHTWFYLYLSYN